MKVFASGHEGDGGLVQATATSALLDASSSPGARERLADPETSMTRDDTSRAPPLSIFVFLTPLQLAFARALPILRALSFPPLAKDRRCATRCLPLDFLRSASS
jgi:hypothetical protein